MAEFRTTEFEWVTVNGRGEIIDRRTHKARQLVERLADGVELALVGIPAGRFLMGAGRGEGYPDERPQHPVDVAAFWLGQFAVTQAQWAAVLDDEPPYRCRGAERPADRVSWTAAQRFCQRLAAQTGRPYRLPSEAEWEYACRAGTTTPFYFGETITTDLANYVGEYQYGEEAAGVYRHVTTAVGSFPPNAWGLYDMHGNVWEWCADAWHHGYEGAPGDGRVWAGGSTFWRVLRGGCWHDPPDFCRSAARLKQGPEEGEDFFGCRVALTAVGEGEAGNLT